ncbi:hypothetical protein ACIKTA_18090, partial [Hansschlegelia beijingensis]
MPITLASRIERWPVAGAFSIARGSVSEVVTVVVELSDGARRGRGECRPYARYGETPEGVKSEIDALAPEIASGLDRAALQSRLPAGAARNALDCAFWDLEAKRSKLQVERELGGQVDDHQQRADLQLLGGIWILQTLPALVFG